MSSGAVMIDVLGVVLFALSMSITPGPNNVMVTASGANFGFARTVPHMAGIALGFPLMLVAVGLGLGGVFTAYPAVHQVMKFAGAAYLVSMAWRIATATPAGDADRRSRPLTFLEAAAFQWVNPKAWIIALGALTTYTRVGGDMLVESLAIAGIFMPASFLSVTAWALFGLALRRLLTAPAALRAFNVGMAVLLVLSLVPLFI
ncbi:MAG TPA: LysE family translocator [Azospirillaceae bacterium]|nr:LysE family translocator [Azospirillaceae bacterium]